MRTEQIEAAIDKVLRKRGAAGSSYFTAHRLDLKRDLLTALGESWRLDFSARGRLTPAELAKQIRWECIAAETPLRASDPAVMVGSEHSGPDLSFLEGESKLAEKTYVIGLFRDSLKRRWEASIKEISTAHLYPRIVDRVYGGSLDSRWDVLNAAKILMRDLKAPQIVCVNSEGTEIQ